MPKLILEKKISVNISGSHGSGSPDVPSSHNHETERNSEK